MRLAVCAASSDAWQRCVRLWCHRCRCVRHRDSSIDNTHSALLQIALLCCGCSRASSCASADNDAATHSRDYVSQHKSIQLWKLCLSMCFPPRDLAMSCVIAECGCLSNVPGNLSRVTHCRCYCSAVDSGTQLSLRKLLPQHSCKIADGRGVEAVAERHPACTTLHLYQTEQSTKVRNMLQRQQAGLRNVTHTLTCRTCEKQMMGTRSRGLASHQETMPNSGIAPRNNAKQWPRTKKRCQTGRLQDSATGQRSDSKSAHWSVQSGHRRPPEQRLGRSCQTQSSWQWPAMPALPTLVEGPALGCTVLH